jgi:hypothetical protein
MSDKVFLNNQGVEEESERSGWEDKRPFLVTLFDPFNIGGLIKDRREKRREKAANAYPLETKETDA